MFRGADPAKGWEMTDPIYKGIPTMGACRPDIRRAVERGDFIFSVSGRVVNIKPHVVGAFSVDQKIDALMAYDRFPEKRMRINDDGILQGNVIVDEKGERLPFDYHTNHAKRVSNYIIGADPIFFDKENEIEKAKNETLEILNYIFGTKEEKVSKIIARWRKMDASQVKDLLDWMKKIKS